MKYVVIGFMIFALSGCFGEKTLDATNEETLKKSTLSIKESLPKEKLEDFNKAMMYFSIGGESGFKSIMGAAFAGNTDAAKDSFIVNLQSIDGLTGVEIINKHKKIISEKKAISDLESDAEELLKSNKFQEAINKYKDMGNILSGVKSSEEGIAKTNKAMHEFTEKMGYIDKIEITEFLAKRIDTYLEKGIPAVRISLKNNGERSLDMVKVIVYFQDKEGRTIFEEDFTPVLVSEYSFSGNNKPLRAGYINEMEKDKFYTIESELSEWVEGKAYAKVVDIRFSK